jgi:predicted phage terminase large subunit-like protein
MPHTPEQIEAAKELKARRDARSGLIHFGRYCIPGFVAKPFHTLIAGALQRFSEGLVKRLMIFAPPQHGKSWLSSYLCPAFHLGQNPDHKIILASYGSDKALDFGRSIRDLMAEQEFNDLFPGVRLAEHSKAAGRFDVQQEIEGRWWRGGSFFAVGAGGPITGRGAHRAIIDDLIKGYADAYSKAAREKVWKWYTNVLMTRLAGDEAGVLILNTRWHEDDLCGRLLKEMKNGGERWEVISIPALAQSRDVLGRKPGEALWPEIFSADFLKAAKRRDLATFNALYQQDPSPESGILIHRDWLHLWQKPPKELDEVLISWDLAFKGEETSSRVAGQVWGRKGSNFFLVDRITRHMEFTETLDEFMELMRRWPEARAKLVEDKANGPALNSLLKKRVPGLIMVPVNKDKVNRLRAVAPLFKAGNVYLPDPAVRPWAAEVIEELVKFPNSEYNDDVDATTQALAYWSVPEQGNEASFEPWEE